MIKTFIFSNSIILEIVSYLYNAINLFRIKCTYGNELRYSKSFLKKTCIKVINKNNTIKISDGSFLENCSIFISGELNHIYIGENCRLKDLELHMEDNCNYIYIGNNTTVGGKTHLACIEGTKITIGNDCMFSKEIVFRTGDSHSIINQNGLRINVSKDIVLGNHIWVGNKVIVTKGVIILDNSIIATGSVVTKAFDKKNIIIAGSPAKIIKENINWLREKI